MIKVLYYYYYCFYTHYIVDSEPHATTVWTLGFSFSLLINSLIDIPLAFLGVKLNTWVYLGVFILTVVLIYLTLIKTKKHIKIIQCKPVIFNSHQASIIISILFFIFTLSLMFLRPFYVKYIINYANNN